MIAPRLIQRKDGRGLQTVKPTNKYCNCWASPHPCLTFHLVGEIELARSRLAAVIPPSLTKLIHSLQNAASPLQVRSTVQHKAQMGLKCKASKLQILGTRRALQEEELLTNCQAKIAPTQQDFVFQPRQHVWQDCASCGTRILGTGSG